LTAAAIHQTSFEKLATITSATLRIRTASSGSSPFDRQTGTAILRGGDVGWNKGVDVTDGGTGGIILGEEEQLWLQSCLRASRKQRAN